MEKQRIDEFLKGKTELEITHLVKSTAQSVHQARKRLDNALKVELETSSHCSRVRRTTLYANSFKANKSYNDLVDMLKVLVKKL